MLFFLFTFLFHAYYFVFVSLSLCFPLPRRGWFSISWHQPVCINLSKLKYIHVFTTSGNPWPWKQEVWHLKKTSTLLSVLLQVDEICWLIPYAYQPAGQLTFSTGRKQLSVHFARYERRLTWENFVMIWTWLVVSTVSQCKMLWIMRQWM